ncbi:MAG: HEAT repeat domain-containing protein [Dehalococcoidia bacterium]
MPIDEPDADPFEDDEAPAPLPPPSEAIAEIVSGTGDVSSQRLRALSEPDDGTLASFVGLWPRIAPERRRDVLAWLERLAEDDVTLDFHRIHLSALRDEDAATRILAVRGLWEEERVEYMHLLVDQLRDDPEATVRAAVTDVLGQWVIAGEFGALSDDDVDIVSSMLREAIEDIQEEPEVRARALEALGPNSHESTSEVIGESYEAGSQRMRLASLRAMGRNAADDWLPVLLYNFDDDDPEIRVAAAIASGQLLMEAAIDPLTELLEDDSEEVQLAAIAAIGEIAGDDAERVLTSILGRREAHLVEAASAALNGVRMLSIEFDDTDDEG